MTSDRRRLLMAIKGASAPAEAFIEFLEGVGGQRIDTGLAVTRAQTRVVIDCQFAANFNSTQILVGYNDGGGAWFGNVGGKFGVGSQPGQKLGNSNVRTTITINYLTSATSITDGTLTASVPYIPSMPDIYIFSVPQGYYSYAKVWSVKVYEGATLVADMRPYRMGSIGCIKDVERDIILYNSGTGDFLLGPDI